MYKSTLLILVWIYYDKFRTNEPKQIWTVKTVKNPNLDDGVTKMVQFSNGKWRDYYISAPYNAVSDLQISKWNSKTCTTENRCSWILGPIRP